MEKTTQEQLDEIAREYGWRVVEVHGLDTKNTFRYKQEDREITVAFTNTGTIKDANCLRPALNEVIGAKTKDKFSIVDKWLRRP